MSVRTPRTARWTVTLYLDVPDDGAAWDHDRGIDALVWDMRDLLRDKHKVWFEYKTKSRKLVRQ